VPQPAAPQRGLDLVPRPDIDVSSYRPDFHDELRWPLRPTQHPALHPSFDVAAELAYQPTDWSALCRSGVQLRTSGNRDIQQYLRGWCHVLQRATEAALGELVPLTRSRLGTYIRVDIANILANERDADAAEHWLQKFSLARESDVLDLTASSYLEVGTTNDARAINRFALENDEGAAISTKCMRWARAIVMAGDRNSSYMMEFDADNAAANTECARLKLKLRCWANRVDCADFYEDSYGHEVRSLIETFDSWATARETIDWLRLAMAAGNAPTVAGAADLAMAALENARRVEGVQCARDLQAVAKWVSRRLDAALRSRPDLSSRLEKLNMACEDAAPVALVAEIRSRTLAYTDEDRSLLAHDLRTSADDFWAQVVTGSVFVGYLDSGKIDEICDVSTELLRWRALLQDPSRYDVYCNSNSEQFTCTQSGAVAADFLALTFDRAPQFKLVSVFIGKQTAPDQARRTATALRKRRETPTCSP
jgi:hypothetical protein